MPAKIPALVAVSALAGWIYGTWSHATDKPPARDATSVTRTGSSDAAGNIDPDREAHKSASLQKQVRELESRMLAQERMRPAPNEGGDSERRAEPMAPAQALAAERAATARAATIFARQFEASTPTPEVSASYFNALESSLEQHGLPRSALREVQCTQALCRMTFRVGALTRDDFEVLWGQEPLRYGSFDFENEDGTERIVYAGLPRRPLEFPRREQDAAAHRAP